MTNENLRKEAAERLRRAVASEAYDDVQTALKDYRREVEAAVSAWSSPEPPPLEVVREAMELTNWALRVVRASRARTRDKIEQVSAVLRYRTLASPPPRWKLEA
jgi:hypothetical protein